MLVRSFGKQLFLLARELTSCSRKKLEQPPMPYNNEDLLLIMKN